MRKLLAGPWVGECGWAVATWIPYLRHISHKYDEVIIVCDNEHNYLYKDFATDFIRYKEKGKRDRWKIDGEDPKIPKVIRRKYRDAKVVSPNEKRCTAGKREYRLYGHSVPDVGYDLVIHARNVVKNDWIDRKLGQPRNWPIQNYNRLVVLLKEKYPNLKIASIGTVAFHVEGTEDRRWMPMETLCDLLHNSRLVIGPSSGPMHLAAMCGANTVVWTDAKYQKSIKGTNRQRYEKLWRPPFQNEVKVVDQYGWLPPVEKIFKKVVKRI